MLQPCQHRAARRQCRPSSNRSPTRHWTRQCPEQRQGWSIHQKQLQHHKHLQPRWKRWPYRSIDSSRLHSSWPLPRSWRRRSAWTYTATRRVLHGTKRSPWLVPSWSFGRTAGSSTLRQWCHQHIAHQSRCPPFSSQGQDRREHGRCPESRTPQGWNWPQRCHPRHRCKPWGRKQWKHQPRLGCHPGHCSPPWRSAGRFPQTPRCTSQEGLAPTFWQPQLCLVLYRLHAFHLFIFSMSKLPIVFKLSSFRLRLPIIMQHHASVLDGKWCQEMSKMLKDVMRCHEMSRDVKRCQEMPRDAKRCQESAVGGSQLTTDSQQDPSLLTETWTHNIAGLQWRQMGREGLETATSYKQVTSSTSKSQFLPKSRETILNVFTLDSSHSAWSLSLWAIQKGPWQVKRSQLSKHAQKKLCPQKTFVSHHCAVESSLCKLLSKPCTDLLRRAPSGRGWLQQLTLSN